MTRRRIMATGVLLLALAMSNLVVASPHGLGSEANEGCLCHTPEEGTIVDLAGLPEAFASNSTYQLTLTVTSPITVVENGSQGGFRLLVDEGTIDVGNSTMVQVIDGGWTHTTNGSNHRSWVFEWRTPEVNDTAATFVVHGNAVNGNNAPTGDAWKTLEVVVPGEAYQGPLTPNEGIDGVSASDRVLLVIGLVLIGALIWAVARP
tara:strand:+ start:634 stop:1248 length:615 start_codon:yes stop_codon:yes gene_type:complete